MILVDLVHQVQKILPTRYGGVGNAGGWGNERLIARYMNDTGATITRGTLVKLVYSYDDSRITKTTDAKETVVVGVVVGRYSLVDPLDQYLDEDVDQGDSAAVCISGRCRVDVSSTVTRGQFAYTSATDGKAVGGSFIDVGALGIFESSGTSTAIVRLYGTPATPGMVSALGARLGDGVTLLQVGTIADLVIPFDCTVMSATLLSKDTGSCVVDVYVDTYGNFPPTGLDSITALAPPTISSDIKSQDVTLVGWTVDLTGGDTLRFAVESASGLSQVTCQLGVIRR